MKPCKQCGVQVNRYFTKTHIGELEQIDIPAVVYLSHEGKWKCTICGAEYDTNEYSLLGRTDMVKSSQIGIDIQDG